MSHAHYSIVFRHDLRLMDVAWHRHFAAEDVGPYAQACKAEFTRQGFHPGYLLRMDMSQSAVQPQDAIAMFRTHFEGFPRARRIAAIGPLNYGVDLGQVGGGGEANIHGGALVELRGRGQSSRRPDKPLPARD